MHFEALFDVSVQTMAENWWLHSLSTPWIVVNESFLSECMGCFNGKCQLCWDLISDSMRLSASVSPGKLRAHFTQIWGINPLLLLAECFLTQPVTCSLKLTVLSLEYSINISTAADHPKLTFQFRMMLKFWKLTFVQMSSPSPISTTRKIEKYLKHLAQLLNSFSIVNKGC